MLERIRAIRASEKRFYQKVRDLFALSVDYDKTDRATQQFFAIVQNQLLYAVTGKTAAEIVLSRASADAPHFGLMTWQGADVRRQDIVIAKNYLSEDEVDTLNRLVTIFLETAELRAKGRQRTRMAFWRDNVAGLITSNGFPLLEGAGSVSRDMMKTAVTQRFSDFEAHRHHEEAIAADEADEAELRALEETLKHRHPGKGDKPSKA